MMWNTEIVEIRFTKCALDAAKNKFGFKTKLGNYWQICKQCNNTCWDTLVSTIYYRCKGYTERGKQKGVNRKVAQQWNLGPSIVRESEFKSP